MSAEMGGHRNAQDVSQTGSTGESRPVMRCRGCGGKVGANVLAAALERLDVPASPYVKQGLNPPDDAAVLMPPPGKALVQTVDQFRAFIDDPYLFARIAANHCLGDVFAMGGKPLVCLNLIGFPTGELGPEVLAGILEGALTKITEAGAVLAGGHTTEDDEPKFGLSVTGIVHPDRFWRNCGALPGDVLVLTKPIGSGVLFNGNLKKWVSAQALDACVKVLTTLNKAAAETLRGFDVHAVTDVTGFGLGGHAFEMAKGSSVTLEIDLTQVPVLAEALDMYERGVSTGVNVVNRQLIQDSTDFGTVSGAHQELLVDPQTSGGLLVALPAAQGEAAVAALREAGVEHACTVGRVVPLAEPHYLAIR